MPGYTRAARPASSSGSGVGDGEAAALRLWRETGVRVLPGGYLGRATATAAQPGRRTISAWRWSPTPPRVERGLDAIRDDARATAIPEEKVG